MQKLEQKLQHALSCVLVLQAQTWADREAPTFATLAGTPGYMPPQIMKTFIMAKDKKEVLEAEGTYDGVKADVYSMGKALQIS